VILHAFIVVEICVLAWLLRRLLRTVRSRVQPPPHEPTTHHWAYPTGNVIEPVDGGKEIKVIGWELRRPRKGDILRITHPGGVGTYEVTEAHHYSDPSDMFNLRAKHRGQR
jgi:hypothetical protein